LELVTLSLAEPVSEKEASARKLANRFAELDDSDLEEEEEDPFFNLR
jgi:hypothetical protein